jgi:hypothetical protein
MRMQQGTHHIDQTDATSLSYATATYRKGKRFTDGCQNTLRSA